MLRSSHIILFWFPFLEVFTCAIGATRVRRSSCSCRTARIGVFECFWGGVVSHASVGAWPFGAGVPFGADMPCGIDVPFGLSAPGGGDEGGLNCVGVLANGAERTEWCTLSGPL